jgi:hypothetical protein
MFLPFAFLHHDLQGIIDIRLQTVELPFRQVSAFPGDFLDGFCNVNESLEATDFEHCVTTSCHLQGRAGHIQRLCLQQSLRLSPCGDEKKGKHQQDELSRDSRPRNCELRENFRLEPLRHVCARALCIWCVKTPTLHSCYSYITKCRADKKEIKFFCNAPVPVLTVAIDAGLVPITPENEGNSSLCIRSVVSYNKNA